MDDGFAARYVNDGFSGGEKKRLEMLQMAMLEPEFAILDETDSGLDIDALRIVAEGVNAQLNPNMGVLLITHYQRLLNYITPDVVHVLAEGRIVTSGGKDLALRLEDEGYGPILRENGMDIGVPTRRSRCPQEPEAAGRRPVGARHDHARRARSADPARPGRAQGRLPDPRPGGLRAPAGLPGLGGDVPEAARGHRGDGRLLPRTTTRTSIAGSTSCPSARRPPTRAPARRSPG